MVRRRSSFIARRSIAIYILTIGVFLSLWALPGAAQSLSDVPSTTEVAFVASTYAGTEATILSVEVTRTVTTFGDFVPRATALINVGMFETAVAADISASLPTTLIWEVGETGTQTIPIGLIDDGSIEGDQTFVLNIADVSGGIDTLGQQNTRITISDPTPSGPNTLVQFQSTSYSDAEGNVVQVVLERVRGPGGGNAGAAQAIINVRAGGTASVPNDTDFSNATRINWAAGDTAPKVLPISLFDDLIDEGKEDFILEIDDVTGDAGIGSPDVTSVVIEDSNPGQLRYVSLPYQVEEGDSILIQIERFGGSDGQVTISLGEEEISADNGLDFSATGSTQANWSNGETGIRTISYDTFADLEFSEGDEIFEVFVIDGFRNVGPGSEVVTIIDSAPLPMPGRLSFITDYTVSEAEGTVVLEVTRTGGSDGIVSASYQAGFSSGSDTADAGSDYAVSTPSFGTLTWADGDATSKFITYDIVLDTDGTEGTEQFDVLIDSPMGGAIINDIDNVSTVMITDVAPQNPGAIVFAQDYTVSESSLSVRLVMNRVGGIDGRVTAQYSLGGSNDTAELNADYADIASPLGTLVWEDNDGTSKFIDVDIVLDTLIEGDEFFTAEILDTTGGAEIDNEISTVTITDTPPPADEVRFEMARVSVQEDVGTFDIVVQRVGTGSGDVEVFYDLVSGTATLGTDFDDPNGCCAGTLFWSDDDLTDRTIPVTIVLDADIEADENFTVELSLGSGSDNVNLGTPSEFTVTIEDVPPLMPGEISFEPDSYTVSESDGQVQLVVGRFSGSDGIASVDYLISGGSATVGIDHAITEPVTGTLTWAAGNSDLQTINVDIANDAFVESDEQFTVVLSNAVGAILGSSPDATVNILDSTTIDTVFLANADITTNEDAGILQIAVERVGEGLQPVSVLYSINSGSAIAGEDFGVSEDLSGTLTWAVGASSTQFIEIDIVEDAIDDPNEAFEVQLADDASSNNPVLIGTPDEATVTIVDVPAPPPGTLQFNPDAYTVSELDGSVNLTVTRNGGSDGALSVRYRVLGGTAILGTDHAITEPVSGTLTWADGDDTARTISVDIATDSALEADEVFSVELFQFGDSVSFTIDTAVVTIVDSTVPPADEVRFEMASVSVQEDVGTFDVVVQRVGTGSGDVEVFFDLVSGTATLGSDFESASSNSGSLFWASGDLMDQTIPVTVILDTDVEGDENFTVELSIDDRSISVDKTNPVTGMLNTDIKGDINFAVGRTIDSASRKVDLGMPSVFTVTIEDIPPPTPGMIAFAQDYTVSESSLTVRLEMTRIGGTDGRVTADYSLGGSNDTAELSADYANIAPRSGTLVWEDNDSTSKFIDVDIVLDTLIEGNEFFAAEILSTTGGAAIDNEISIVTITDNPPPADEVRFEMASVSVQEDIGTFDIIVQRVGTGSGSFEVFYDLASGTATLGTDFDGVNNSSESLFWANGDLTDRTIPVTIVLDTEIEDNESFTVELSLSSEPGNVILGMPSEFTVTIADIPPSMPGEISFEPDSYTIAESDGQVQLVVGRFSGSNGIASVDYLISGGSATVGIDHAITAPVTGTLTWAAGNSDPQTIDVDIANDAFVESDEQFSVVLSNAVGATLGSSPQAIVNILDSTTIDTVFFANAELTTTEDVGILQLAVQRAGAGLQSVSVLYVINNGIAVAGEDYGVSEPLNGTLTWPAGDTSTKFIEIDIVEDAINEPDEAFEVQLADDTSSNPVLIGTPDEATVTIVDVPAPLPGTLQFTPDTYTVSELDGSVSLTVTRVGGSDGARSVSYEVLGGTAILGTDHATTEPTAGTLTWTDGDDAARTITVDIANDSVLEVDEVFSVELFRSGDEVRSTIDTAMVTIVDSTVPDSISLAEATAEVAENSGVLALTVQRSGSGIDAVSVLYSLVDGTAESGIDYAITSLTTGTVSWAAGDLADKTIEIDIATDAILDPDETLLVNLSLNPASQTVTLGAPAQTTVTITDIAPPEPGFVQFDPDEYTVAEVDGIVELQVTRTTGSAGPASAQYEIIAGTATLGTDVGISESLTGVLEWPAGDDTPRTITVDLATDDEVEGEETFSVELSGITGAASGNATTALVNLMDSTVPTPDTIVMADDSVAFEENVGSVAVIVQRVGSGVDAVSVAYSVADDTATAGLDFDAGTPPTGIVSWAAGDTADKSISIDLIDDALVEDDETFSISLSPDAASLLVLLGTPDSTIVTIADTTPPPVADVIRLAEAQQSALESEARFDVVISRTGNGLGASSVNWTVSPGSASVADDIELDPLSGSVNWPDGDTDVRIVTIPIAADTLDEPNETLTFTLSQIQGAVLGSPQSATLTIIDDDEPPEPGTIQFVSDSFAVDEDAGVVTLDVTRSNGDDGQITVLASTIPGSASTDDFSDTQTLLTWADGDNGTRQMIVPIVFDSINDPSESFTVVLGNATPDDSVLGVPMSATVTINEVFNGEPGAVQFASAALAVDETDASVSVSVTRTGGNDGSLSVNYSTSAGSAASGEDFEDTSGTLNWLDGDSAPKSFSVAILADALSENTEQFTAVLSGAEPFGDASIGSPDTVEISINDVEPAAEPEPVPELQAGTVQFVNATGAVDESAGTLSVSVARTGGTDGVVSVRYETVDGSAVAGDDFDPISGRLQWADGESDVRILRIAIDIDTLVEADEQFQVVLSDAQPREDILGSTATVDITILDDSVAPPGVLAFTTTAFSVAEADGAVELQVSRAEGSSGAVSVAFTTLASSADEADFEPSSGRLNWADGDVGVRTIRVPVNRDGLIEADEQFQVVLSQSEPFGDSAQLGTAVATVSISDSTQLGTLSFVSTELSVTESEASVTLSVSRSGGSDGDVSVDYNLIGGSAELGLDLEAQSGTLNWADLDTEPKSIEVLINTDDLVEANEQFIVALSNAMPMGPQQIDRDQLTVTIIDSTRINDISTPQLAALEELDLLVVSGDGQGGLPGELLEPLVIDVIDRGASDATVADIPILWRAVPEGSAELIEGGRTVSNDDGRTSKSIRILSRGFLRVIATIDVAPPTAQTLAARNNNPPPFPIGQGEAVFTVRSGIGTAVGLRTNQAAVGTALDAVCEVLSVRIEQQDAITAEEQDLFQTCLEVEARLTNDDGLGAALDRLTPEELFFLGDSVIDTTDIQVTNVYSRINAIRSGQVDTFDVSGLQFNYFDQSIPGSVIEAAQDELSRGGAASADDSISGNSRLGFFATGSISYGDVDGGENQSDGDFRSQGLTLGADYRATDNMVFGAGIGFINSDTDFNPDAGSADINGLNLTLFGTYFQPNKGYVDVVLDIGRNEYDIERRINLPNTPDQFGVGDTTANIRSLTIGAGRDFRHKSWEFGPYGRLSLIDADIDGYSERAAGSTEGFGSVLNVGSHSVQSARLALGGQLSRTISTKRGVFVPQFRIEAEFENEDRKDGIQATFQHDPTQTPFTVSGEDRDSSYINLGIGSSALFRNGRSGFLFYETQQGNDRITQHWLKFGIRLEF